jgi:hypothetical protein
MELMVVIRNGGNDHGVVVVVEARRSAAKMGAKLH